MKIDNSDKYEIVLVNIRLNSQNDNKREEYVRTYFTDEQINAHAFSQNIEAEDFFINNHIRDEYNNEIVKKLKYKDLINIFNPEIDDYNKVIKIINNLRPG